MEQELKIVDSEQKNFLEIAPSAFTKPVDYDSQRQTVMSNTSPTKLDKIEPPLRRMDSLNVGPLEDNKNQMNTVKSKKSNETLPIMQSNRPPEEWNLSNVNPKSPHE